MPKVIGSGSCDSDIDANASFRSYMRAQKEALLDIYRELGIDPSGHHHRPVQAPPAPTPTPEPTPTDPLRSEAALWRPGWQRTPMTQWRSGGLLSC